MNKKNILFLFGTLAICIPVLIYIFTKASVASFTHDESFTYLNFVHHSFMDIISHRHPYSNNHLLNSLLMKYSELSFGTSEFTLRLPNLFFLIVFFIYSFLLLKKFHPLLAISVLLLLTTNNVLIDLFGLARGYGLSFAFMMMSIYHLIQSFRKRKNINQVMFTITASFAILSNITMLDFYFASIIAYNLVCFAESKYINRNKFDFIQTNKVLFISLVVASVVLYEPVRRVIKFNLFDFGGKEGFMNDTVNSVIRICFNGSHLSLSNLVILQIFVLLIVFILFGIIISKTISRNKEFYEQKKALLFTNILLIVISTAIIFQHLLFKTDYPVGRFSVFLFILLILNFSLLLDYLTGMKMKNIILAVAVFMGIVSAVNFRNHMDYYCCAEWSYDSETKNAMIKLMEFHQTNDSTRINAEMGINWMFEPTINFYRQIYKIDWLCEVDRKGAHDGQDFYYIFTEDSAKLNLKNYTVLYATDRTKTVLLKNNR